MRTWPEQIKPVDPTGDPLADGAYVLEVTDDIVSLVPDTGGTPPDLDDLGDVDTTGKADGDVLTYDSGSSEWVAAAPAGGGGWDHPITLPLSTLTGWTAGSGSWSITSSVIRQATTSNAVYRLHLDTLLPLTEVVAEVDIKLATTPNTVSSRGGIVFGTPRTSDGGEGHMVALLTSGSTSHATVVNFEQDSILGFGSQALPAPIVHGTWIRFRVHKVGPHYSVWVDGNYLCTWSIGDSPSYALGRQFGRIALYSYASDVSFRNLDIWTPTLP